MFLPFGDTIKDIINLKKEIAMESTLLPFEKHPTESGITLLEAYSALASHAKAFNTAIDIPTPGLPSGNVGETNFWHLQVRSPV